VSDEILAEAVRSGVLIEIEEPCMKKRKYQSEPLMVIHMMMEDAYRLGLATDEEMRHFDEGCLVSEPEPAYSARRADAAQTGTARSKSAVKHRITGVYHGSSFQR
jgi:hypothetical protein